MYKGYHLIQQQRSCPSSHLPGTNLAQVIRHIHSDYDFSCKGTIGTFSAVCWLYGRDLYDAYSVPIGLISSDWGGTAIDKWSSPDALAKCKYVYLFCLMIMDV